MTDRSTSANTNLDFIFSVLAVAVFFVTLAMALIDIGPAHALNDWQASLTGGSSFPILTTMLLSIAFIVPLFLVKAVLARAGVGSGPATRPLGRD